MTAQLRDVTFGGSQTLKTVIIDNSTGASRWWNTNTSAFEAYNPTNIAQYGIATSLDAGSHYTWIVPALLPATTPGLPYKIQTFTIAGATLATGDLKMCVSQDNIPWSGSVAYTEQNVIATNVTSSGSGAFTYTITVEDNASGFAPISGASVSFTNGVTQLQLVTNFAGQVTFNVNAGVWVLAIAKSGYQYNGSTLTVSGNGSTTVMIMPVVLPPPPAAGQLVGYLYTQLPGITIYYEMTVVPPGSGMQFDGITDSATSDSSGLWSAPLYLGATYQFNTGNGPTYTVVVPNSGTTLALGNLLRL